MHQVFETEIHCPYCGEPIEVIIETLGENQEYIEDCQVCCRPIVFSLSVAMDGSTDISVRSENETY